MPQLMYEPCFDTLRTKEQLGYSVHSGTRRTHGVLGLCVVVVSGTHGPAHLDERIEAFLAGFAATLAGMGEEAFEKQRQGLLALKMMKVRVTAAVLVQYCRCTAGSAAAGALQGGRQHDAVGSLDCLPLQPSSPVCNCLIVNIFLLSLKHD